MNNMVRQQKHTATVDRQFSCLKLKREETEERERVQNQTGHCATAPDDDDETMMRQTKTEKILAVSWSFR